jgi:TolA-binding protein
MSSFHILRQPQLILATLYFIILPVTFAQEAPSTTLKSDDDSGMTEFYELQQMDEELRALRGDFDSISKRLTEIESAQKLIHDLLLKVSTIEEQIQIDDGSQSNLANIIRDLKSELSQLTSKVNLLDADIRKSLEVLAGDLISDDTSSAQVENADNPAEPVNVPVTANPSLPPLSDEKRDVKKFYEYAKELYDNGSYREAIQLFGALNEAFPESQYAKSGLYWSAKALKNNDYKSLEALNLLRELVPRLKNHNKHCVATLDAGTIHLERRECADAKKYLIDAKEICARDVAVNNRSLPQKRLKEYRRYCADD